MMRLPAQRSKIVCTIGPASDAPKTLERMIRAGMNVARLNLAHGTPDEHRARIDRIRAAAEKTGQRVWWPAWVRTSSRSTHPSTRLAPWTARSWVKR